MRYRRAAAARGTYFFTVNLAKRSADTLVKMKTKIGLIKPAQMLSALSQDVALSQTAREVEEKTIQIIDEAK